MATAALLTALQLLSDTLPDRAGSTGSGAFLDPAARELVLRVRARRAHVDESITAYQALARERITVGVQALRRERVLYRRELAARVHWRREGVGRVEVLGGRRVIPVAVPEPTVPDDLREDAPDLAFHPGTEMLLEGFGDGNEGFRHPLAEGAEADYRYATGDTTDVRLASGQRVRLVELRVLPRRADGRLLRGSFWIHVDNSAPVRAVLRLARPVNVLRDLADDGDEDDVPGVLKPMVAELDYLIIDYALWEGRWWLPRLFTLEGTGRAGAMPPVLVRFERRYDDYRVAADPAAADALVPPVTQSRDVTRQCRRRRCSQYVVEARDTATLLGGESLPPSIYADGAALVSEGELRELMDVLRAGAPVAGGWTRPALSWEYLRPELVRYNRVEGLALGARVQADAGAVRADASAWLATADLEPAADVGVSRERPGARERLGVYRRLATVEPGERALGVGSSLAALLLGRDDADYYRTLGLELSGTVQGAGAGEHAWRLFAERQAEDAKATDFSLPRLWDGSRTFQDNIAADQAEQLGAEFATRWWRGLDPTGWRWGGQAEVMAQTGTFRFVRPSLSTTLGFPLPGPLVGALELAGGTTLGRAPVQSLWYLGGPTTVRGYGADARVSGESFWRGRAELGGSFPAARLVLFSDAGWAGERSALTPRPDLLSAGVGASFLDGLLRLDLARALREPRGWRLDVYLDAVL